LRRLTPTRSFRHQLGDPFQIRKNHCYFCFEAFSEIEHALSEAVKPDRRSPANQRKPSPFFDERLNADWLQEMPEDLDVFIAQRSFEQAVDVVLKSMF